MNSLSVKLTLVILLCIKQLNFAKKITIFTTGVRMNADWLSAHKPGSASKTRVSSLQIFQVRYVCIKSSVQSLWLLCHRTEDGRALRLSFGFPELLWHPSYAAVEKKIKIKSLFFFFLSSSRLSGLYFVILRVSQASRAAPQAILNPPRPV